MGKQKESAEFFSKALSLAQQLGRERESDEYIAALKIYETYNEGKVFRSKGNLQESSRKFEAAVGLARKIKSPEHELKCLRQLGYNYLQTESFNNYFLLSQRCLEIAKQLNHMQEQGRALNNIGVFYWKSSNYAKALACYEDALTIAREVDNKGEDESTCLNNIGILYMDIGDYDKALQYLIGAIQIDQNINNSISVSTGLNNIGEIFRNKGEDTQNSKEFAEALSYYFRSLELSKESKDKKLLMRTVNNIGLGYAKLGKLSLALSYFQLALRNAIEIEDFDELCHIWNNIGNVYLDLETLEVAKRYFNKALNLANKARRDEVLWETYFGLGRCLEYEGQPETALGYYKMAVEVIDSMRRRLFLDDHKAGFVRNKLKVYEALIHLLFRIKPQEMKSSYDEEIFRYIERAKARGFIESLRMAVDSSHIADNPIYLREKETISKKITAIFSELSNTALPESKRKALLNSLEREEGKFSSLLNRIRSEAPRDLADYPLDTISIQGLQSRLDQDSAILEYFLGERESYALFFSKNDFVLMSLPPRRDVEESLKAYLNLLSSPPSSKFRGILASRRLYRDFIFPFEKNLSPSLNHLIIIPDGVLYYLPFETLIRDRGFKKKGQTYLVELYEISYAPSVSSLTFLADKKEEKKDSKYLLALGHPSYSCQNSPRNQTYNDVLREIYIKKGFDFSPIPHSKKEVQDISRNFPRDKVDIYLEDAAREEVIKKESLENYRIIHFACHGFLDEKSPFRSALVLTLDDDTTEDGFLQVREILDLKLNADLVVLSACQTGRGKLENGEGILGLPRIFFYVGARSTISTLWKINDHSTSDLMRYFYQFLIKGNGKAKALRLAKIKMIRSKFSHPFFWAGFVLNGDCSSRMNLE